MTTPSFDQILEQIGWQNDIANYPVTSEDWKKCRDLSKLFGLEQREIEFEQLNKGMLTLKNLTPGKVYPIPDGEFIIRVSDFNDLENLLANKVTSKIVMSASLYSKDKNKGLFHRELGYALVCPPKSILVSERGDALTPYKQDEWKWRFISVQIRQKLITLYIHHLYRKVFDKSDSKNFTDIDDKWERKLIDATVDRSKIPVYLSENKNWKRVCRLWKYYKKHRRLNKSCSEFERVFGWKGSKTITEELENIHVKIVRIVSQIRRYTTGDWLYSRPKNLYKKTDGSLRNYNELCLMDNSALQKVGVSDKVEIIGIVLINHPFYKPVDRSIKKLAQTAQLPILKVSIKSQ